MSKVLVSYFSASGVTKRVAEKIAVAVNGDIFEIEPVDKYTAADLDWKNKESRSSIEMNDKSSRPSIVNKVAQLENYDTVVIGFPIWWYTAPTIVNTFLDYHNLEGKKVYVFVTSGGSSADEALKDLKETYPKFNFVSAKRFNGNEHPGIYSSWVV